MPHSSVRVWRCIAGHINQTGTTAHRALRDGEPDTYSGYCRECTMEVPVMRQYLLLPIEV